MLQQSWPVGQAGPLPQPDWTNRGAGVRPLGAWACPPARVARNCAVAVSVAGAAGVCAMACANGMRARRARRTRTGFFIGSSPLLDRWAALGEPGRDAAIATAGVAVVGDRAAHEAADLASR